MAAIVVTLVPTGSPNEYDMTLPSEIIARHSQISRPDAATIEAELVDGEIGYQEDTQQLVYKDGANFRRYDETP